MDIEQAKKAVGKELRVYGGISEKVNRYIGRFYQRQIKNGRIITAVDDYRADILIEDETVSLYAKTWL